MTRHSKYETIVAVILLILLVYYFFRFESLLIIAMLVGFLSVLFPKIAQYINYAFDRIISFIGKVNSRILLSLVFAVILTPISLLYRMLRKGDSLSIKYPKDKSTYKVIEEEFSKDSFINPW